MTAKDSRSYLGNLNKSIAKYNNTYSYPIHAIILD